MVDFGSKSSSQELQVKEFPSAFGAVSQPTLQQLLGLGGLQFNPFEGGPSVASTLPGATGAIPGLTTAFESTNAFRDITNRGGNFEGIDPSSPLFSALSDAKGAFFQEGTLPQQGQFDSFFAPGDISNFGSPGGGGAAPFINGTFSPINQANSLFQDSNINFNEILGGFNLPSQIQGFDIPGAIGKPDFFNIEGEKSVNEAIAALSELTIGGGNVPLSTAEQALLSQTLEGIAGINVLQGSGGLPTQGQLVAAGAPTFQRARENQISSLQNFINSLSGIELAEGQQLLQNKGLDVTQREQTIGAEESIFQGLLGQREGDIGASLADLQRRQTALTEQDKSNLSAEQLKVQQAAEQRNLQELQAAILGQILGFTSLPAERFAGTEGRSSGFNFGISGEGAAAVAGI